MEDPIKLKIVSTGRGVGICTLLHVLYNPQCHILDLELTVFPFIHSDDRHQADTKSARRGRNTNG